MTYTEGFLASESYEYLSNRLFRRAMLFDSVRIIIKRYCLKADFQSSHEAPRSSLRVLTSN